MQTETKSILLHNQGRDPERLRMKLSVLRADPYAFFRGTAAIFMTRWRCVVPLNRRH